MTREDLKDYKYNQEWIKDRLEYLKGYKTTIENITSLISDMPKREQTSTRQHGRKNSTFIGYGK